MALAVVEAQNLAMGQRGSILVTGTTAVTCSAGTGVFIAIQFLEDSVFASAAGGLIAETEQLFPDDTGTGTLIDSDGGAAIDGQVFPQGMTLFGRYTGFTLASGAVIGYVGQMLSLGIKLQSVVMQTARLARDLWSTINDTWQLEERKWEDII